MIVMLVVNPLSNQWSWLIMMLDSEDELEKFENAFEQDEIMDI